MNSNSKGFAHILLIILGVLGIGLALFLVGKRTNFLPSAQQDLVVPQTGYQLRMGQIKRMGDGGVGGNEYVVPGDTFKVDVLAFSDIDSANAFSAYISYPKELVEVQSIIKKGKPLSRYPVSMVEGQSEQPVYVSVETEASSGSAVPVGVGCKIGGCSGQVCQNVEDGDALTVCGHSDEEWARIACTQQHSKCEKQKDGNCGWTQTPELTSCLGGGTVCAQVVTRACNTQEVQCIQAPCPPQEVCKDFPTPCDVPPGWYLEKDKCQSDSDCKGIGRYCDYLTHPPRTKTMVCKTKEYACWNKCSEKIVNLKIGDKCNPADFPYQQIIQGDIAMQLSGCAINEQGETKICQDGVVQKYSVIVQGSGITNISPFCPEEPKPSCKPIPQCVYSNPACDIYIDPNDPTWCRSTPPVKDYFIKFWLPDTRFDNENGKLVLSGGVTNPGIKTTPPNKPIMATIVFKALKNGDAKLTVTDESLILRNSDSANIITRRDGLEFRISDQPLLEEDLDGDGSIGFKDFSILLSKWGTDDKKADLNHDGKVNIYDFSKMLSKWKGKKK